MKYYLIFLMDGKVVDLASYDEEEARTKALKSFRDSSSKSYINGKVHYIVSGFVANEIQTLNIIQ